MTGVVLDTHALVWLLDGNPRLGPASRALVTTASAGAGVHFSAISAWEIAMLVNKDRLALDRDVLEWLRVAGRLPGVRMAPLSIDVSVESTRLPEGIHGDPADRLIAATARRLGVTLVTADAALLRYAGEGHLDAHDAGT